MGCPPKHSQPERFFLPTWDRDGAPHSPSSNAFSPLPHAWPWSELRSSSAADTKRCGKICMGEVMGELQRGGSSALPRSLQHLSSHLQRTANPHPAPFQPVLRRGASVETPSRDSKASGDGEILCPSEERRWFALLCFQEEQQGGHATHRSVWDGGTRSAEPALRSAVPPSSGVGSSRRTR